MKTILYIHGYNSNGNARKGQLLRTMVPEATVVSPTLDYDHTAPTVILETLKKTIAKNQVDMIVGSSFGGFYTLCCTSFFDGPVWVINPVRDVLATLRMLVAPVMEVAGEESKALLKLRLQEYEAFDKEVFQQLNPKAENLNMALSLDDDLLGDHNPLLERFPNHNKVVWKDQSGHHFTRFEEVAPKIRETLGI